MKNKNKALTSLSHFFEKRSVRAGLIFALTATISGTITYFAMPNFIGGSAGDVDEPDDPYTPPEMSSVDQFASKLTEATGFEGVLNLDVTFPDKDSDASTMNNIKIDDASLKLAMPTTGNLGFDFQGTINYNDWSTDNLDKATTHINFADKNAYIDVWGAKIAYLDTEYKPLVGELMSIFSDSIVKIPDELYDILDKLLGDNDSSSEEPSTPSDSSSSSDGDGSSLADTSMDWSIVNEGETENEYQLAIGLMGTTITLRLTSDKDYNLTRVYLEDFKYEDITVNLDFKTTVTDNALTSIRALTPTDTQNYTSLLGLKGIIRKIGNAIAKERFGVAVDLNLNHFGEGIDENIGINLDGSLDFGNNEYMGSLELSNKADTTYSQNLALAYLPNGNDSTAYVNYNDLTKASMNLVTLEALLGRMQNDGDQQDLSFLTKVFDFVLDSEVVKQVQNGRYGIIADEVEKINVSADKIVLKLKLDKLGFATDSSITITFDGGTGAPISDIEFHNIKAKGIALDGHVKINSFLAREFDTEGYYRMDHLPDMFDQVSDLVNDKKATLSLNGSVLDKDMHGVALSGKTSFDANLKEGTGSLLLSQINANYTKNHIFTADVNEKQAFFNYNDNDKKDTYAGLNGLFSISSVQDLIDMITSLTGDEAFQKRFGGIFSSLESDSTTGIINDVVNGKYAGLLSAKILKKCDISSSNIDIVINGELFALESDIEIVIGLADTTKPVTDESGEVTDKLVRNIESITLKDFAISGQTINLTLTLEQYDSTLTSLDKNLTYTDFSSVSTLAQYMLNTATNLNTYHLKSSVSVILWTADIITLDADMYISITEEGIKIFGTLSNIPLIPAVNNDTWLFGDHGEDASFYRDVTFYYDATNVYVHGVNPFGTFDYEDENGEQTSIDLTETQDYKYETNYFNTVDNILHFVLKDIINMQDRLLAKVDTNGITLPESKSALATEKLFNSFSYDKDNINWDLSLDLGGLLENDFLKTLDISIGGTDDKYLDSISLALTVFAGVKLQLLADVTLENVGADTFPTDTFNSYIESHKDDALTAK